MTTSNSDIRKLQEQADVIARQLKEAERGKVSKLKEARTKPMVKFGLIMDDKFVKIEMSWIKIKESSYKELAAYLVRQMQGKPTGTDA